MAYVHALQLPGIFAEICIYPYDAGMYFEYETLFSTAQKKSSYEIDSNFFVFQYS